MLGCCGFASDKGTGDTQIVENNNDPKDAPAQLVDKVRLDQLQGIYSTKTTMNISEVYPA